MIFKNKSEEEQSLISFWRDRYEKMSKQFLEIQKAMNDYDKIMKDDKGEYYACYKLSKFDAKEDGEG